MTKASVKTPLPTSPEKSPAHQMELVCTVQDPTTMRIAVDSGANCVQLHYMHAWNTAFNPDKSALAREIGYAHHRFCKVVLALHGNATQSNWERMCKMIDYAAQSGADAILMSDPALMLFAAAHHPHLPRYLALPEWALNAHAINAFDRQLGLSRVVLPRVLSLPLLEELARDTQIELEVPVSGRGCIITAGRLANLDQADKYTRPLGMMHSCATPTGGLQGAVIGHSATSEAAANESCYATGTGPSSNALHLLPHLMKAKVNAIQLDIDGSASRFLAQITRAWRESLDNRSYGPRTSSRI
ncbi:hypothetical protein D3870_11150 [Noviherbaspirillum cavernae]|uniref:Uncharacterized protein n=1 Tax=Noviherbaspirillum cavernae TaxID=2320862 RepID=A0A418X212_9BURK|nr:U32 family peptidase [Noviherbaspirillum cavernae]RJG06493.1 hypothetical protein D3870_11150 [Noviherbaspirillum cavernae]